MLLYAAYPRIGVGLASLLYYCGPVLVLALSPLLFRERLSLFTGVCFLCVLAGAALIGGDVLEGGGDLPGFLLGLLSVVTSALMVIGNKKAAPIAGLENAML